MFKQLWEPNLDLKKSLLLRQGLSVYDTQLFMIVTIIEQ